MQGLEPISQQLQHSPVAQNPGMSQSNNQNPTSSKPVSFDQDSNPSQLMNQNAPTPSGTSSTSASQPNTMSEFQQQQPSLLAQPIPSIDGPIVTISTVIKPSVHQHQPSPVQDLSSESLSNNNESGSNEQPLPLTSGLKPESLPASAPSSQLEGPFSDQETESTQSAPCDMCKSGQVARNIMISLNGKLVDCVEAYNVVASHFKEGSTACISAQSNISHSCCSESQGSDTSRIQSKTGTDEEVAVSGAFSYPEFDTPADALASEGIDDVTLHGDQNDGDPDWLLHHWETRTSSPSSRRRISLIISMFTPLSLWFRWILN